MERFLDYFIPSHYELEECISRQTEQLKGRVCIAGKLLSADVIKIHAVDLAIINVGWTQYQSEHQADFGKYNFETCDFKYDGQVLEIEVADKIKQAVGQGNNDAGEGSDDCQDLVLEITFATKLNNNMQGCYISSYDWQEKQRKIVATQFESHYAREAFPCIDEPAAKATFNLSIEVPDLTEEDVVLANTELTKREGKKFTFASTPRMSTYLLAWVIGPLKSISAVNKHGVRVTSYCALNQTTSSLEFANEVAVRALDYYDDKFGIVYPLSKLDQVALPDFEAGAMENWGLVTYRESCMLAEPNASIDTKQSVAITVTHELSHQWFGDLVTMAWWDDLWLNESFATIMEYYATDALYPELKAWRDFYTSDCVAALRRDCLPGVQAVQQEVHDPAEIATLFDAAIVYAKGARLVLMLMNLMGEENFYRGVHDYFQDFQYQNTVGDDLWNKLQKYAKFDIKEFMHAWISQPGFPALQRAYNGDNEFWAQQRFLINATTDDTQWPLPEVKDDMSGHYIIDLSSQEFNDKLGEFDKLSLGQKLRLLIDRMMLAKAGLSPSADLLDLLPKFADEDVAIWDILLSIINDLKIFCPEETQYIEDFREFLRHIIHSRVRTIGIESQPNDNSDVKRLRNIFGIVARFARDQEIIDLMAQLYQDGLSSIDAEIRGNVLMAKMMVDENQIFPRLLSMYETESDPELKDDLLCAIAIAKQESNIKTLIDLLKKPKIVRPQDHLYLYIYLLRNYKTKSQALEWLYKNWDYVIKIAGEKSIEDYPRCVANYIDTPEEAKRFYEFFDQKSDNPILKRALAMARVSIEAKLRLIAQESEAVHQRLIELVKGE